MVTIYEKAISKWGKEKQIDVAIEELAELIKALIKNRRKQNQFTEEDVKEELADVEIMLTQLKLIYGDISDDLRYKLKRLEHNLID